MSDHDPTTSPDPEAEREAKKEAHRKAYAKAYRKANKNKLRARDRLRFYKMTQADFDAMLLKQEGKCAICHEPFNDEVPHVDHCHETKKVRALLCRKCNVALGHFGDDPVQAQAAAMYLDSHGAKRGRPSGSTKCPSYRLHKASGQAVVTIDRHDRYLGVHGTPESRLRYERLITAWMQGEPAPARESESSDITVAEVCVQYLRWAEVYYVKDGKPTTELGNVKRAIKALRESYPCLPAKEFSPLKLKTVRQRFIDGGLCRTDCNRFTGIVARIFRYAVENELIPPDVAHGLEAVKALAKGRCDAPETDPVLPVEQDAIDATLPHLSTRDRAMIKIQLLLACRPGELVSMRSREIDRSEAVWIYRPRLHKTMHKGKDRIIPIGPRARLLLAPWLPEDDPDRFVWRSQRGGHVSVAAYGAAIRAACQKAGIPAWSPNRLRHSGATRIRQQASLDAAQVILGHSSVHMTETYAERNLDAARRIAAEVG